MMEYFGIRKKEKKKGLTVAVDGWSSSGKSTMARRLAAEVGYRYVDTGAMYRAVALWALERRVIDDEEGLAIGVTGLLIGFAPRPDGQHTLLQCVDVEEEIRSPRVSAVVSRVAAIPAVRRTLAATQRAMGRNGGVVMDGRDIGTVVFPKAELKIFVDAPAETRARRRYDEYRRKGVDCTYDEVLANVRARDLADSTRAEGPLRRAPDALVLDNSEMTPDEQAAWLRLRFDEAVLRANAED